MPNAIQIVNVAVNLGVLRLVVVGVVVHDNSAIREVFSWENA